MARGTFTGTEPWPGTRSRSRARSRSLGPGWLAARAAAVLFLVLLSAPADAQDPSPSPTPSPSGPVLQRPSPSPVDPSPRTVRAPAPRRSAGATSADAGALKELRGLSIGSGEARIQEGASVRTVRPGDRIGGDVVQEIGDGQMVLSRSDPERGEATVVVRFDAQGRTRVRVIWQRDKTPRPVPSR